MSSALRKSMFLLATLGAILTSPPAISQEPIRAIDYPARRLPFEFGMGFDTTLGRTSVNPCVIFTTPEIRISGGQNFAKGTVSTFEQRFSSDNSASVGISAGYGIYSGSAAYDSISRSSSFRRSLFVKIEGTFETDPFRISNVQLTQEAKGWLSDPVEFRSRCGDVYVESIVFGAYVVATRTYSFMTDNEYSSEAANLRAAVESISGNGSLQASASATFSRLSSKSEEGFEFRYIGDLFDAKGGSEYCQRQPPDPRNVDDLIKFAMSISCRASEYRTPLVVYVRPYAELLGRDPATPFVGAGEFQRGLIRAYERRASLRYALRHRDQFGGQWNSWDNADAQVAKISDLIERCTQSFEKIIKDSRGGSSQNDVFITNVGREEIANCLSGFSLIPRSIEPSSLLQANIWRRGIHPLTVLNYNKPFGAVLQGTYNRAGGDAAFECPRDCVQARVGSVIIRRPQNVTVVNPISGIDNTYRLIEIPTDAISLDWEMPDDGKWDDNLWRANSGILVFERVVPISGLSR